jgi:hypothetical protein
VDSRYAVAVWRIKKNMLAHSHLGLIAWAEYWKSIKAEAVPAKLIAHCSLLVVFCCGLFC